MLTHIVSFKYKPEVSEVTRADHRAQLRRLRSLAGIIELKVGADLVGSARSYDTGLVIHFPDRAALDAYQQDPLHVPVARHGASLCDHIVAVDFVDAE
jgi:hypothetical protein